MIEGKDLIAWGFKPGAWFKNGLSVANEMASRGAADDEIKAAMSAFLPVPYLPLRAVGDLNFHVNITPDNEHEAANIAAVIEHMKELMRVPTVRKGSIMPDACPSDKTPGTIPVGGVIAAENAIHPGMHSADICCSVAISILGDLDQSQS